jgi:NAD(P)-binding Rossmann-like domain/Flavin containing amine oxidoreductase
MSNQSYDLIIIGGGVSGLYARWKLSMKYPAIRILLLEKKPYLGGRIKQRKLGATVVQLGAGVIRANKDATLLKVASVLGLQVSHMTSTGGHDFQPPSFDEVIKKLSALHDADGKTFEHWLIETLGQRGADEFIRSMGYTDMLEADAAHTVSYYGLEDNDFTKPHTYSFISGGWMTLIDRLLESGRGDALTSTEVLSISKTDEMFQVSTLQQTLLCRKLLICTTAMFFRNTEFIGNRRPELALDHIPKLISSFVGSVPFVRVYVKLNGPLPMSLPDVLIVDDPCRKLIPIDRKEGVLMLVYSDSQDAIYWKHILDSKPEAAVKRDLTFHLREHGIRNREVHSYIGTFWTDGIHYFRPVLDHSSGWLSSIRNPVPNLYIGGEMVALRQGWVNGALECIEELVREI